MLLRSKLVKANPSRITPACSAVSITEEYLYASIFVDWAGFDFFVRFQNPTCCINARRNALALANSVRLLASSHSDGNAAVDHALVAALQQNHAVASAE